MSEHSIEAYKKLCEGIRITFEALPVTAEQNSAGCLQEKTLSIYTRNTDAQVSFSAKIAEYFKNRTVKYSEGVKRMLPVLEKLNFDIPHIQGDFNEVEIVLSD